MPTELKHSELTDKIIGVFYDVYNELGCGFLESVYREALLIALRDSGLHAEREFPIPVFFRGQSVGNFHADLLVNRLVLLELKVARTLDRSHEGQLLHYLKGTEIEIGLLLNFGQRPEFRRLILDNQQKKIRENPRQSAVGFS